MAGSSPSNAPNSFKVYLGTFFIAFSTLAFEVTLTRLLSVISFYHLAFFAVSTAMLGMTAGATTVYFRPKWFRSNNLDINIAKACSGYVLSVPVSLIIICLVPLKIHFSLMKVLAILSITFGCSLPFYFSGIVVSVVLTKYALPIGKLYASDLIGASLGCLFVLGGLELFSAPTVILFCGAIGIVSVFSFSFKINSSLLKKTNILVFVIIIAIVFANIMSKNGIRPIIVKDIMEDPRNFVYEEWNSFSRITVSDPIQGTPRNWGPSPVTPNDMNVFYYPMTIDGFAGTFLHKFSNQDDLNFLRYDVTNAAYFLKEGSESACIIGVGGGKDVHSAICFGIKKIVGIDVNPIFIDLHRNKFKDVSNISGRSDVRLVVDEARSYLSRSTEKFSIIQMSLIDTWAATGAGAFTLTENSLYTTEAWKVFISHLDSNGFFTLSRWYNPYNLGETGRVVSLAVSSLLESGIKDPSKHIAMLTVINVSTLIIKKLPFTSQDISKLREVAQTLKYNLEIIPDENPTNEVLRKIVSSGTENDLHAAIENESLNYTAPTDDNPYFFNMLRISHLFEAKALKSGGVVRGNLSATLTLVILIFSLFLLAVVTIIIPLLFGSLLNQNKNINKKLFWTGAIYFSLIGAGFMMTEIGLMQRLSVFLGHPVYALGILLFTIILSAGIGSFFSERLPVTISPWKYVLPAVAALAILSINFVLNAVISAMITSPMMSKILVSILVIFPMGFTLGFFFPMGMKFVKNSSPSETPWFWALNGVFGVLFSALAVFFSIYFGISTNFYLASICYAAILLLVKSISYHSSLQSS